MFYNPFSEVNIFLLQSSPLGGTPFAYGDAKTPSFGFHLLLTPKKFQSWHPRNRNFQPYCQELSFKPEKSARPLASAVFQSLAGDQTRSFVCRQSPNMNGTKTRKQDTKTTHPNTVKTVSPNFPLLTCPKDLKLKGDRFTFGDLDQTWTTGTLCKCQDLFSKRGFDSLGSFFWSIP